jgi:hypothetical protein
MSNFRFFERRRRSPESIFELLAQLVEQVALNHGGYLAFGATLPNTLPI